MGLEVVLNEIVARGQEEEQKILADAERERRKLLDAAEGEADEIRAKALQETRTKVDAVRREVLSASEFEVRRRLLTAQRELGEDFKGRVQAALAHLPAKEREKILGVLIHKAQKELAQGKVHATKEDLAFVTKHAAWAPGGTIAGAGGFQVESPDGSIVLDQRFETLLDTAWPELQREAQKLLQG